MNKALRTILVILLYPALLWFWGACGGGSSLTVTSTTAAGKVYTTSPISVTFSQAMDQASVESAFSITGSDPVAGTFSWANDTVTFTPDALWKTHHPYTLTITTAAKSSVGSSLAENYTQTFTPQINLHDVNGDGIDDFMAGAPGADGGATDSGVAYLFFGKETWEDIDLATQAADGSITTNGGSGIGYDAKAVGDMNGDGFADIAATSLSSVFANNDGFVAIFPGSVDGPGNVTLTQTDLGNTLAFFRGPVADTLLGLGIQPVGDVNGDGLADLIIEGLIDAQANTRYWLVLGQTTAFPDPLTAPSIDDVAAAIYSVNGTMAIAVGSSLIPVASCDINDDELDDLIIGAPASAGGGTLRGEAYVVAGSTTPSDIDLRTQPAAAEFLGPSDNVFLGSSVTCGDVNGDGFEDILIGASRYDTAAGRAYFVAGTGTFRSINFSSSSADAMYTGPATTFLGMESCIPGDVNDDGYDDAIIGGPYATVAGTNFTGQTFLFLGNADPQNVDLGAGGSADATYSGVIPPSGGTLLGYCKAVGDINNDGVADILLGAPVANAGGSDRGQAYLIFGEAGVTPPSIDFNAANTANATITGAADDDVLLVQPAAL